MLAKKYESKNNFRSLEKVEPATKNKSLKFRFLIFEYLRNFNRFFKSSDLNWSDFERIESKKQSYKSMHNPWENF